MTTMTRKLNKPIAGYHLLMLLTVADNKFTKEEGDVIITYLKENFPFRVNLDEEIDFLSTLPRELYADHFRKAMIDFYDDSIPQERTDFLNFAVKLVAADHVITKEENAFLKMLYNQWAPEFE